MKIKIVYLSFFIITLTLGYVIFKSFLFFKYSNKLEISDAKPTTTIEQLLSNDNLNVRYIKSYKYSKECIGYNAIINEKYYVSVVKLGKTEDGIISINKSTKEFKNTDVIGFPPVDTDEQAGRYMNFSEYPFNVKSINYFVDGQELDRIDKNFTEITFEGKNIYFSFNNKNNKSFGYVVPIKKMSVSFIIKKGELYSVNLSEYKNFPIVTLHSLIGNS